MQTIIERTVPQDAMARLMHHGVDPVLARVFASRGIRGPDELELGLDRLASYSALANAEDMGAVLADAIQAGKRLLIVGDYDADGATSFPKCTTGRWVIYGLNGAALDDNLQFNVLVIKP